MISAALARAHHLLNQEMLGYLDTVELLTNEHDTDDETVLAVARAEVPRLVAALRATVATHKADPSGDCPACHTTWPCAVIDSAHSYLKDPDSIYSAGPAISSTASVNA
ncbi:hypothetical protein FHX81_5988 [Saccharothrix saharensis]|uniref:Uncharacterized protein n=1 Tax=Saccharothrix saharensis TaxID=571190 RepID=A0A543JL31_9PSEU|nr:hypothetical protein [Saccharothrix saharensis]TQM83562.1 hypothetical protein FHX81_5988 [Saccharothrix saharensis]